MRGNEYGLEGLAVVGWQASTFFLGGGVGEKKDVDRWVYFHKVSETV